jgi:signal transduction histidine kinase
MGHGVEVSAAVVPLKDNFRELIVEVARKLEPYFPDITARWREQLTREFALDARTLATLEQLTIASACIHFKHADFEGFFEMLNYFGTRLSKLQLDTRILRRALEIYENLMHPYVSSLFGDRETEALAALEMVSSFSFVIISGAYFDTRTLESSSLLKILDVELGDQPLESMLQQVLEILTSSFGANVGAILLHEPEADLLRVEAAVGLGEGLRGEFSMQMGKGFAGHVFSTGEPDMIIDANKDPRVIHPRLRETAKALWGMPLRHDGRPIGVMLIGFDKPYEWLPTEKELLRAIADRSALAIHRSRITHTLREREARIAELSAHLLRVQEEERNRISRELHDETGQGLMVIRLYLGMLRNSLPSKAAKAKVDETLDVVDRTVEGIRRIIGKLSPLVLQELGLFAALRKEALHLEQKHGVSCRVAISDEVGRLSAETETAIYRIVQEALHNIAKHAQAQNAAITMDRVDGKVKLAVEDDGVGIFPKTNYRGNSFGLAGIKERVGMLGGEVRVASPKGQGTRIDVTVPATEPDKPHPLLEELQSLHPSFRMGGGEGTTHAENKMSTH